MTVELTPVTELGATLLFAGPSVFIGGLMFPFKQSAFAALHPTQSSTDTQTYTLPLKFVVSLCHPLALRLDFNACRFFWSDSHALWRAVEGWMGAQSAIAFINTNSYARCSQVSISSQCSFSLGVNAHF